MLGGLAIGLIETFWSAYFSSEYKDVAAFSILIVVLIFLPTGLLGRPGSRESLRSRVAQVSNPTRRAPSHSPTSDKGLSVYTQEIHPERTPWRWCCFL